LAETAFAELTAPEQAVARRILLRVAESPDEQAYVRRRVPLAEVAPPGDHTARQVLDTLAGRRLLTVEEATVEVAHEALLREWPRLRTWLDEDDTGRRLRRHLAPAARDWADHGRHPSDLDRGPRLATALEWARDHEMDLTTTEREFLAASRALHTRTLHRLRATVAALTALLAVVAVLGVLAWQKDRDAQDQRRLAEVNRQYASRYLVSRAQAIFHDDPQLSLLLTVAAARIDDNAEAGVSLLGQATLRQNVTGFLTGHTGGVDMAYSSDGGTLAAVGADGTIILWNLRNPTRRTPLTGHNTGGGILALAFSPGGKKLASAGEDGTVNLWDVPRHTWIVSRPAVAVQPELLRTSAL